MSESIQPVRPGDLITAEFMNVLLRYLEDLDTRVKGLEDAAQSKKPGRGPVVITGIEPVLDTYTIGQMITVKGGDFGYSVSAHSVSLNKTPVLAFEQGSNDSALIFKIVAVDGLPEAEPGEVTMTVGNFDDKTTRKIYVQTSSKPVAGYMYVESQGSDPQDIIPGNEVSFGYQLRSETVAKRCTIKPKVLVGGNEVKPKILSSRWRELPGGQLNIAAHGEETFYIYLKEAPAERVKITVTVDIEADQVTCLPDTQEYVSGALSSIDTTIDMSRAIGVNPSSADIGYAIQVVSAPKEQDPLTKINLVPGMSVAGTYDLSLSLDPADSRWSVTFVDSAEPTMQYGVDKEDIPDGGHSYRDAEFQIRLQSADAPPTTVIFTIKRKDQTAKQVKRFKLIPRP